MSASGTIRLERRIAAAPAAVWRHLVTPELVAGWWTPCTIRAEVGHRFEFDLGKWGRQPGEVLEVEVDRRLVYSFAAPTLGTTIAWTLAGADGGTRVELVHGGFNLSSMIPRMAYDGLEKGWPKVLDRLAAAAAAP
jgi:uncharacterized protein YndB with AHSA1/START domain